MRRELCAAEMTVRKRLNHELGWAVFYGLQVLCSSVRGDPFSTFFALLCWAVNLWMSLPRLRTRWRFRATMRKMVAVFGAFDEPERTTRIAEFNRFAETSRWQR